MTKNIWAEDKLNRKMDAEYLIHFLTQRSKERAKVGIKGSFVLNLDAPWGHGKTFFLTRMEKQLASEEQGYLVAYINAWEDDHASDPLLAVISEIDKAVQPHLTENKKWRERWIKAKNSGLEIAAATIKHAAMKGFTKIVGEGAEELSELYDAAPSEASPEGDSDFSKDAKAILKPIDRKLEALLKDFRKQKSSEKHFRENLQSFLELVEKDKRLKLPFFILIDELDRCRPTHAVEMLERIKHLFDIPYIVFVLATDTSQLRHVVRGVYGGGFDSTRYLLRFFDRTYMLTDPDTHTFVKYLFENNGIDTQRLLSPMDTNSIELFSKMMQYFELGLRDIEQCFDIFHDLYTGWKQDKKIHIAYLLPLICTFQQGKYAYFDYLSHPDKIDFKSESYASKSPFLIKTDIHIDFSSYSEGSRFDQKHDSKTVDEIIRNYLRFLQNNWDTLKSTLQNGSGYGSWLASKLQDEMEAVNDRDRREKSIFTYNKLRDYPRLVRNIAPHIQQIKNE